MRAGLAVAPACQCAAADRGQGGVWLDRLVGWEQYLREHRAPRSPGLLVHWTRRRKDLAWDGLLEGVTSWTPFPGDAPGPGTPSSERPCDGASVEELIVLSIAVAMAPGGLLGDVLPRLDRPPRSWSWPLWASWSRSRHRRAYASTMISG